MVKLDILNYSQELTLFVKADAKAVYLDIPKAAGTSIKRTFFESEEVRDRLDQEIREELKNPKNYFKSSNIEFSIFKHGAIIYRRDLLGFKGIVYDKKIKNWVLSGYDPQIGFRKEQISVKELNSYFIFTFVRNPFRRLVSCFQDKYRLDKTRNDHEHNVFIFQHPIIPILKEIDSFDDLINKLSYLDDMEIDRHLVPQSTLIELFTQAGGRFDFIGKFENLKTEFEPIRKKYDLLSLEHQHKGKPKQAMIDRPFRGWRDYWTVQTAKTFYERYRKDFEMFGYQNEYPKLLNYLSRKKKPLRYVKRWFLGKLGFKRYQIFQYR